MLRVYNPVAGSSCSGPGKLDMREKRLVSIATDTRISLTCLMGQVGEGGNNEGKRESVCERYVDSDLA